MCFEAKIMRGRDKKPLVARFGGISLVRTKNAILVDRNPTPVFYERKEVVRRLIAGTCELCGLKEEHCVVHQVRKLAELVEIEKEQRPPWALIMLKKRRKTLIVCQTCHHALHEGYSTSRPLRR